MESLEEHGKHSQTLTHVLGLPKHTARYLPSMERVICQAGLDDRLGLTRVVWSNSLDVAVIMIDDSAVLVKTDKFSLKLLDLECI